MLRGGLDKHPHDRLTHHTGVALGRWATRVHCSTRLRTATRSRPPPRSDAPRRPQERWAGAAEGVPREGYLRRGHLRKPRSLPRPGPGEQEAAAWCARAKTRPSRGTRWGCRDHACPGFYSRAATGGSPDSRTREAAPPPGGASPPLALSRLRSEMIRSPLISRLPSRPASFCRVHQDPSLRILSAQKAAPSPHSAHPCPWSENWKATSKGT